MKSLFYHIPIIRCLWLLCLCDMAGMAQASDDGRRRLFDDGWRFCLGDFPEAKEAAFDDSGWRLLNLPHDWSIEGEIGKDNPSGNDGGYYPAGIGWYRKTFRLDGRQEGRQTAVFFEGVYMNSEVFINGRSLGVRPYGYSSFRYDLTPYLVPGDNVLAVRVDNSRQKNSRWYTGSGIYRHVWLRTTGSMYIDDWSLQIKTAPKQGTDDWTLDVDMAYVDAAHTSAKPEIRFTLYDADGQEVATACGGYRRQVLTVDNPRLWSPDTPYLYKVKAELVIAGKTVDSLTVSTGFRTVDYDAVSGFRLNGKPVLLNGACVHHDNGILGAAAYDRAERRKAELLKQAGFNAVRTSHNVPSEAFLRACDELGLLVMDEAFDGWRTAKTPHDYSVCFDQWWERDVEAMVLRDRNHPSIFCWSVGNEVIERKQLEVLSTARKLVDCVNRLDGTRPVTSALTTWDADWEIFDPLAAEFDIVGYNYQLHRAPADHKRVPYRVVMQTESYPRDAFANWALVNDNPYIIGDFVWTGLDYLGEAGIGRFYYQGESEGEHYERNQFPWHGAYCGDIDLTGWRKPISHYRDMLYNPEREKLYMAVREPDGYYGRIRETMWSVWPTWESWNWPGHEGKTVEVEICSRYPKVRLYLNDRLIGEQPTGRDRQFKAVFSLPYEPGTLKAVGVDGDGETAPVLLRTAGNASRIRLTADRRQLTPDGQDLTFVTVELTDGNGTVNPIADNALTFEVKGAGSILAVGNADLKDSASYTDAEHKAWKGRALVVLKSNGKRGKITLKARGDGLRTATLAIEAR